MSRQELAEAVNAAVFAETGRVSALTANYVGKLEAGLHRWPIESTRRVFRAVLGAERDADLGFFIVYGTRAGTEDTATPADGDTEPSPGRRPAEADGCPVPGGTQDRPTAAGDRADPLTPNASARHLLGAELRRWRHARGLSAAQLAGLVYASRELLHKIEYGHRNASADLIAACDTALDTGGALGRLLNFAVHQEREAARQTQATATPSAAPAHAAVEVASIRIMITAEVAPPVALDHADDAAAGVGGARIYRFPPPTRRGGARRWGRDRRRWRRGMTPTALPMRSRCDRCWTVRQRCWRRTRSGPACAAGVWMRGRDWRRSRANRRGGRSRYANTTAPRTRVDRLIERQTG